MRRAASSFEEDIQPFVQPKHNLSDPSSLHKDCDFTLDLKAVIASKAGSGTASQGLPSHPPGLPSDSQGLSPDSESEISELELAGSRWLGRFWRQSSHEKHVQPQDLILNGTLLSRNCGVQLQINATTTHIEVYEAKAVNYTFMVTALTFVQVQTQVLTWWSCSSQCMPVQGRFCTTSIGAMCCPSAYSSATVTQKGFCCVACPPISALTLLPICSLLSLSSEVVLQAAFTGMLHFQSSFDIAQ